jgi:hypothetical protein
MSKEFIGTLKFSHFIKVVGQGFIFASARDEGERIYNFIIKENGIVAQQTRFGFRQLPKETAEVVKLSINLQPSVPTFTTTSHIKLS